MDDVGQKIQEIAGLEFSEWLNREVIEESGKGMLVITENGILLNVNKEICNLTGQDCFSLLGKNIVGKNEQTHWLANVLFNLIEQYKQPSYSLIRLNENNKWYQIQIRQLSKSFKKERLFFISISDVTDTENTKQNSERIRLRYQTLIEHSSDIISIVGLDGKRTFENSSFQRITGTPDEEMQDEMALQNMHPEDLEKNLVILEELKKTPGKTHTFLYRYKHHDGHYIYLETIASNLTENDVIRGILMNSRDVTKRVLAEKALRESEQRFRYFMEVSQEAIVIHDKGVILDFNDAYAKLFGYEREELLGMRTEVVNEAGTQQLLNKLAASHAFFTTEILGKRKDESLIELEIVSQVMEYRGKEIRVVSLRDISKQKATQRALQQSEERLNAAISGTGVGIWDWNLLNNEVYYNETWMKLIGYEPGELMNNFDNWRERVHPDDLLQALSDITDHLENKTPIYSNIHRFKHKDGHYVWMEAKGKTIRDESGVAVRMVGTNTDITDRIQIESELRKAKLTAEKASRVKSEFLAHMSHEIRTPMNGIIGFSELLYQSKLSREQKEYLELIQSSADSLLQIINDLLDLSKIEAGKMEIAHQEFEMKKIVTDLLRSNEPRARENSDRLVLNYDEKIPKVLIGDDVRIKQVLLNFISNAVKFSKGSDIVTTVQLRSLKNDQAEIYFEVRDSGIGIPLDKQEDIFEPFTQADSSITRNFGGTGLGLPISKNLVEMMGGHIGLESETGKGSNFFFTLPLTCINTQTSTVVKKVSKKIPYNRQNPEKPLQILLVEDNDINQLLAVRVLEKAGHTVKVVSNGYDAVAFKKENIDLILMDIHMPVMDGFKATELIRIAEKENNLYTPIVALTARATSEDREKVMGSGFDGYITKPIDLEEMMKILDNIPNNGNTFPSENQS